MLSIAIIIFRESLEVAIVLGVLMATTRGLPSRSLWVWGGIAAGVAGSTVLAFFSEKISNAAEGMGQEIFNALVLVLAVILIVWTVVWMRRYGRYLTQHFKEVGQSISKGEKPLYMLLLVIALSVLREGSEMVLFTYGILAGGENVFGVVAGSAVGLALGILTGFALYFGLVKISTRKLFSVTSWLLIILAAGMVSQAVNYLQAAGWMQEFSSPMWDTSSFLPEKFLLGRVLRSLIGYSEKPTGLQLIAYLSTLGVIVVILKWFGKPSATNGKSTHSNKLAIGILLFLSAGFFSMRDSAMAFPKVYSPIIERGEIEFEAEGLYTFDKRLDKDRSQTQKYAIGYGVTDRWATEIYGELENNTVEGEGLGFEAAEWENRLQLFEQGEHWIDAGLYLSYEFASEKNDAGKIEAKVLLEKQMGDFVHTANLILEREVGGQTPEGQKEKHEWVGGVAWSSRYRFKQYFEPGMEIQHNAGELVRLHSFDEQESQIGPTIYGKIGDHIKYDVGYLFGVSHEAPAGMLKWIVEYELRF